MGCRILQNDGADGCNQGVEAFAMAGVACAAADEGGFGVLDRDAPSAWLRAHVARHAEAIDVAADVEPDHRRSVLGGRLGYVGFFDYVAQVCAQMERKRLMIAETRRVETKCVMHCLPERASWPRREFNSANPAASIAVSFANRALLDPRLQPDPAEVPKIDGSAQDQRAVHERQAANEEGRFETRGERGSDGEQA